MSARKMNKFKRRETGLQGVLLIEPLIFHDSRGFFLESYNKMEFEDIGITDIFIQDNYSSSSKGVLRGLHFQRDHPQCKLVRVPYGEIYDVVVDIRKGSSTYGQYKGFSLSAENQIMLYVPIGFVHGFIALAEGTEVIYKVTDYYYPQYDAGIVWNDPDLEIKWPLKEYDIQAPILSEKDSRLPAFRTINSPFIYQRTTT